jgi:hypothetical protein
MQGTGLLKLGRDGKQELLYVPENLQAESNIATKKGTERRFVV